MQTLNFDLFRNHLPQRAQRTQRRQNNKKCKYQNVKCDSLVKSPRSVILRSGATKNLNDIRFFAIAQNDKRVFFRLPSNLNLQMCYK